MEPSYGLPEFHSNDSPWRKTITGRFLDGFLSSENEEEKNEIELKSANVVVTRSQSSLIDFLHVPLDKQSERKACVGNRMVINVNIWCEIWDVGAVSVS